MRARQVQQSWETTQNSSHEHGRDTMMNTYQMEAMVTQKTRSSTHRARTLGPVEHVGLGLRLERSTKSPDIYIQEIVPGFAAYESGRLQAQDVVVSVDHVPLMEMELEAVKQLTIGEEGSFCTLQVQRGDHYFQVTMMRKFPYEVTAQNAEAMEAIAGRHRSLSPNHNRPTSPNYKRL